MKVLLLTIMAGADDRDTKYPGSIIDVPAESARKMIERGDASVPEPWMVEHEETAVKRSFETATRTSARRSSGHDYKH